jgi:hypothetical protein
MSESIPKGDIFAGLPKKNQAMVLGTILGKDVNKSVDPTRVDAAKNFLQKNPEYTETLIKAAAQSQIEDPEDLNPEPQEKK